ncbi:MAG: hypothetical protein WBP08_02145 [Saprospiraceae bacterium]
MKKINLLNLLFILTSVNTIILGQKIDIPDDRVVNLYKTFLFEDNIRLDSVYLGAFNIEFDTKYAVKYHYIENISRLDLNIASDRQVIVQFLKSIVLFAQMEYFINTRRMNFHRDLFFKNQKFKKEYKTSFNGEKIYLENLAQLKSYDFSEKLITKCNNKQAIITFGQNGPVLKCPINYYKKVLKFMLLDLENDLLRDYINCD